MPYPGMVMMVGLVAFEPEPEPASQVGTTTPERVTFTSAAGAVGQAGVILMVEMAAVGVGVVALYWLSGESVLWTKKGLWLGV
jgi:hypothetical protein